MTLVRRFLGHPSTDADVEDLFQSVWCSLLDKGGRALCSYDPDRGAVTTFLATVVRSEIQRYRRKHPAIRRHGRASRYRQM